MSTNEKSTQQYSGFSPQMIAGLQLWLDAADSNTVTTGATIQWRDKSGNGRNASSVGNMVYQANAINGLSAFNFINTSSFAATGSANPITYFDGTLPNTSLTTLTVFAVATMNANSQANPRVLSLSGGFGVPDNNNPLYSAVIQRLANSQAICSFRNNTTVGTANITYGRPFIACSQFNGSTHTMTVNGVAGTTVASTGTFGYTYYNIGNAATQADLIWYNGLIAEIIVFNTSLTVNERQAVEGYLGWKWGMRSYTVNTPKSISGLALWLDAADSNTYTTSSGTLQTLTDKSGRLATINSIGGSVVVEQNGINGLPVFNMTNGRISGTFSTNTPIANYTHTIFIVTQLNSTPPDGSAALSLAESLDGSVVFLRALDIAGGNFRSVAFFQSLASALRTSTINVPFIWSSSYDGSVNNNTITIKYNGVSGTSSSAVAVRPTTSPVNFFIGTDGFTNSQSTNTWPGVICEILIYNQSLSSSSILAVEGYLGSKWNITTPQTLTLPTTHPFNLVRPFTRIFQPSDIPDLSLWLDAADASTITSNLTTLDVSEWRDKSGNGRNAVGISGYYPTYSNSQVVFNGSTSYLQISNPAIRPANIYVVVQSAAATGHILRKGVSGGSDFEFALRYNSSQTQGLYGNTGGAVGVATVSSVTPNRVLLASTWDGTTITLYRNGTSVATTSFSGSQLIATTGATDLRIGAEFASASNTSVPFSGTLWNGTICEIIIFNRALTTSQRQTLESYLSAKWGISSTIVNTPKSVSGLTMWLDAADSSTITGTTNITEWRDKSGNSNTLTPIGGFSNASLLSNYQNRLNVLNFTGSNVYSSPSNSASYPTDVFLVMAFKPGTTRTDVISVTEPITGDFTGLTTGAYSSLNEWNQASSGGSRSYNTGVVQPTNQFVIINWSIANNNMAIRRNTITLGTNTSYTWSKPTNAVYNIGLRVPPSVSTPIPFDVYIGEVIAYNSILSAINRQTVESYLANKWGVSTLTLTTSNPLRLYPPLTVAFNPAQLSQLSLWFDAADSSTVSFSTGSNISQWRDKSGNSRHTDAVGTPVYNSAGRYLQFDGSTNNMRIPSGGSFAVGKYFSIFVVERLQAGSAANNAYAFLGVEGASSTNNGLHLRYQGTGLNQMVFGFFNNDLVPSNVPVFTTAGAQPIRLWSFVFTPSFRGVYLNGTLLASDTNNTQLGAWGIPTIASTFNGAGYGPQRYPGFLYEMIFSTETITISQRQQVEGFLAWKWGLQNSLPSNHPYKKFSS